MKFNQERSKWWRHLSSTPQIPETRWSRNECSSNWRNWGWFQVERKQYTKLNELFFSFFFFFFCLIFSSAMLVQFPASCNWWLWLSLLYVSFSIGIVIVYFNIGFPLMNTITHICCIYEWQHFNLKIKLLLFELWTVWSDFEGKGQNQC